MFMTDDQKKYYAAMKKMGNKKPVKATPRPRVIFNFCQQTGAGQILSKVVFLFFCTSVFSMVIPVVDFSREGCNIRQVFG